MVRTFLGGHNEIIAQKFQLIVFMLLCGLSASAQTAPSDAKEFSKDGLTFKYPAGWAFNDTSNADAQQLTLGRPDSDAQITVFAFRTPVTSPEKMAEAKRILVDKYVASTTKSFEQMGAHPESSPATTDIGSVKSEGIKIRAALDGVPGAAEIYWALVGQRLIVLTFLGPDKALTRAKPAWDTVRNKPGDRRTETPTESESKAQSQAESQAQIEVASND